MPEAKELWAECVELAAQVVHQAAEAGLTVGCAESCTGGLIAAALTEVPGSSAVFKGGIVAYDPAIKSSVLGVPATTIDEFEVESVDVAEAMAAGARKVLDVDFAVSTTGIAGPGGGKPEKPVGYVCFGISNKTKTRSISSIKGENRSGIRLEAVQTALKLLLNEFDNFQ